MRRDSYHLKGVSIVEVLIGLALLGGLLVAGSRLIVTSSKNTTSLGESLEQARVAQQLSEGVLKEIGKRGVTLVERGSAQGVEMWVDTGYHATYVYDPQVYGNEWRLLENGGNGATLLEVGTRVLVKGARGVIPSRVVYVSQFRDRVALDIPTGCAIPPGRYIIAPQGVVSLASASGGGVDVSTVLLNGLSWTLQNHSVTVPGAFRVLYVYQLPDGSYERRDSVIPYDSLNGRRMVSVELSGLSGNQARALSVPTSKDLSSAFICPPPSPPSAQLSEAAFRVMGSDSLFPTLYGNSDNVTVNASGGYTRRIRGLGTFYLSDIPSGGAASFEASPFSAVYDEIIGDGIDGVRYTWNPSPASGNWNPRPYFLYAQTIVFGVVPAQVTVTASGLPSYASWGGSYSGSGPLASSGSFGGTGPGPSTFQVNPGTYTFSFNEATASRSQDGYSWTEIWTRTPTSAGPTNINSGDSVSYSISYSGPVPGTLCYDGNCSSATPGVYYAPSDQVIRTWTTTRNESCPSGYTGSVTVTESWQTVKYWTPRGGGLSSRGTLRFTSATRDELVSASREGNCEPLPPSSPPSSSDNPPPSSSDNPPPSSSDNPPPSSSDNPSPPPSSGCNTCCYDTIGSCGCCICDCKPQPCCE